MHREITHAQNVRKRIRVVDISQKGQPNGVRMLNNILNPKYYIH